MGAQKRKAEKLKKSQERDVEQRAQDRERQRLSLALHVPSNQSYGSEAGTIPPFEQPAIPRQGSYGDTVAPFEQPPIIPPQRSYDNTIVQSQFHQPPGPWQGSGTGTIGSYTTRSGVPQNGPEETVLFNGEQHTITEMSGMLSQRGIPIDQHAYYIRVLSARYSGVVRPSALYSSMGQPVQQQQPFGLLSDSEAMRLLQQEPFSLDHGLPPFQPTVWGQDFSFYVPPPPSQEQNTVPSNNTASNEEQPRTAFGTIRNFYDDGSCENDCLAGNCKCP